MVGSWLLDLTAMALVENPDAGEVTPASSQDSGEGRWTVMAAIEEAVPAECSRRRSTPASARGRSTRSPRRSSRPCATSSAATSSSGPRGADEPGKPGVPHVLAQTSWSFSAMANSTTEMANPLSSGSAVTLLPQPCVLVIFGGGGRPVLAQAPAGRLQPQRRRRAAVAISPSSASASESKGEPDEWFRNRARDGIEQFSRQPLDEGHWADFARALFYVAGQLQRRSRPTRQLKAKLEAIDAAVRHPRQPRLLPRRPAPARRCRASSTSRPPAW